MRRTQTKGWRVRSAAMIATGVWNTWTRFQRVSWEVVVFVTCVSAGILGFPAPAQAETKALIDTESGAPVLLRDGPAGPIIGQLPDGGGVRIYCLASADGRVWGSVGVGRFIAIENLDREVTEAECKLPKLESAGGGGGYPGSGYLVDTSGVNLNVREGPGSDWPVVDTLPDGASVLIACTFVRDGQLWDHIAPGRYILDQYVDTGTNRPVARECDLPTNGIPPMQDVWTPQEQAEEDRIEREQEQAVAMEPVTMEFEVDLDPRYLFVSPDGNLDNCDILRSENLRFMPIIPWWVPTPDEEYLYRACVEWREFVVSCATAVAEDFLKALIVAAIGAQGAWKMKLQGAKAAGKVTLPAIAVTCAYEYLEEHGAEIVDTFRG